MRTIDVSVGLVFGGRTVWNRVITERHPSRSVLHQHEVLTTPRGEVVTPELERYTPIDGEFLGNGERSVGMHPKRGLLNVKVIAIARGGGAVCEMYHNVGGRRG